MVSDIQEGLGLLSVCLSLLDLKTGTTRHAWSKSVIVAVEDAIALLERDPDQTAVLLVGEDRPAPGPGLAERGADLAIKLGQAGLFLGLAAQDIVRDRLISDVRFEDFGVVSGDGGGRSERIYAVIHPDLPAPALPHRRVAGNCPRLHKSFVGRHREVDELQDMILQRMLVTVIGPPGVGKTTTAINVSRSFVDEYDDGVWWFSVDQRTSLDELLQAIATEKGLITLHGPLSVDRVAQALAPKSAVIVLDGCETMAREVGVLCEAILKLTTTLTVVLTSTRPIGLDSEFIFRLAPMSLPDDFESGEDALFSSDALKLFYARSAQAGVQLGLDEVTVGIVGSICKGVDCLPVAIELVAASLRTTSIDLVVKRLANEQLNPFEAGPTAEKALALSYKALSEDQQVLLQRLAMFRGEWSSELAADLWKDVLDTERIIALHQSLVDCSWIAYRPDRNLFRMLHTIRGFCRKQAGAQLSSITSHFCHKMCDIAAQVTSGLAGPTALESEATLARHYGDFAHCLETSLKSVELASSASAMMAQMVHFWRRGDFLDDAERLSTAFLDTGVVGIDKARALVMLGVVQLRRRKLAKAVALFGQCLTICREERNSRAEALALCNLGMALMDMGEFSQAKECYVDATKVFRSAGHTHLLCEALSHLTGVEVSCVRHGAMSVLERETLLSDATRHLDEALNLSNSAGPITMQSIWHNYGALCLLRSQTEEAEMHLYRALAICDQHKLRFEAEEATSYLAEIHLKKGWSPSAAKMLGLSLAIQRESGKTPSESELQRLGSLQSAICDEIGAERAEKLMKYGEKLNLAEILPASRDWP